MADKTQSRLLPQYVMAVLYPTYENVKRALRDIARDPESVSEDAIYDFIRRMRLPNAKYAAMSMLLAGDYSFSDSQDERKQ
jgi:2-hydroxy-6-oxonona-2,4-dienedioate hydrolase